MIRTKMLQATAVALFALASAGTAPASGSDSDTGNTAQTVIALNAKISLNEAIAAAENATSGKVVESTQGIHDGQSVYKIVVADGDTQKKVIVDANSGDVIQVIDGENGEFEDGDQDDD